MAFGIVEKLGGWDVVGDICEQRGAPFTEDARKKWRNRYPYKMPRDVVAALAAEASARSIEFDENDFVFIDEAA